MEVSEKSLKKVEHYVDNYIRVHKLSRNYRDDLIQECWVAILESKSKADALANWLKRFRR